MKNKRFDKLDSRAVYVTALLFAATAAFAHSELSIAQKLAKPHAKNRVLLKKKIAAKSYAVGISSYLGAHKTESLGHSALEVVDFSPEHSMAEALLLYSLDPSVEVVEPDYLVHATEVLPDDAYFHRQWGLDHTKDGDINAPMLWESSVGDPSIIIAINDTGVDYLHTDLAANIWINPGEIPGNGIDDDQNGYVDDIHGINAENNTTNVMDDNGHGTHIAGTIAAVGNNGLGISGVMHRGQVVSCKFLDREGSGTTSGAIKCLDYIFELKTRTQNPINIVATNNSWATSIYSEILFEKIKQQADVGIAFVTAADNFGLNNDLIDTFPANYALPNVVSVAALDQTGRLARFSNFGSHSVHVAAPGVEIESTIPNNLYTRMDGTSMAAPFITALLGLLSHHFPNNTMAQNKNLLIASSKPKASLSQRLLSGGAVKGVDENGFGAISCQDKAVFQTTKPTRDMMSYEIGQPIDIHALNINCAEPNGNFKAVVEPSGKIIEFRDDGLEPDTNALDGIYAARFLPETPGAYELELDGKKVLQMDIYDRRPWPSYRLAKQDDHAYISFSGTKVNLADDDVYGLKLPFALTFGTNHVYIGSNGTLSLTDHKIASFTNTELPAEGFSTLLAPLWTDLDPSAAGADEGIFYEISGEMPHRMLLIEWRNVKHHQAHGKATFQVVFREGDPNITYSYRDLNVRDPWKNGAQTATVGMQVGGKVAMLPSSSRPLNDRSTFLLTLNNPPIASAKAQTQVEQGQTITLDGSDSTDPENSSDLHYFWSLISGPDLTILEPTRRTTTVSADSEGVAVFSLKVTDDGGAFSTDTLFVTITPKTPKAESERTPKKRKGAKTKPKKTSHQTDHPFPAANTAPAPPKPLTPEAELLVSLAPHRLAVQNAVDQEADLLTYQFEIYSQADPANLIYARSDITSGDQAFATLELPNLSPDASYFWRARAFDGALYSDWSSGKFHLTDDRSNAAFCDTQAAPQLAYSGCSTRQAPNNEAALLIVSLALFRRVWARRKHTRSH